LLANSRFLNGSSTVFGQVVFGMDTVKKIALGDKVTSVTIVRG
jgi:cyclophilin family peptidyl-prolyl cis-trans isomerase